MDFPPNGEKAREVTREPYASLKRPRSFSMTPNYYGGLATAKSGTRRRSPMSATLWPKSPSYVILGSRMPMYCFSLHAWGGGTIMWIRMLSNSMPMGKSCSTTPACLRTIKSTHIFFGSVIKGNLTTQWRSMKRAFLVLIEKLTQQKKGLAAQKSLFLNMLGYWKAGQMDIQMFVINGRFLALSKRDYISLPI